jgi:nitrate reductase molybdenum cofactor assembly chaperone NarJ/NarW
MTAIYKLLSVLLAYPTGELQAAAGELRHAVATDTSITPHHRASLIALVEDIASGDLLDIQERYVLLFDRTRSLSLHLFEHIHGESRDRGQALVDLRAMYETAGLEISARELPDYLPLFLEFLSLRPPEEARALLHQTLHIVAAIGERLVKRNSRYAGVFQALVTLAAQRPNPEDLAALREVEDDDPSDLQALDRVWEEEPVTFGPGAGSSCPAERLEVKLRASMRPGDDAQPSPRR